jgi:hypothetical protein
MWQAVTHARDRCSLNPGWSPVGWPADDSPCLRSYFGCVPLEHRCFPRNRHTFRGLPGVRRPQGRGLTKAGGESPSGAGYYYFFFELEFLPG